MFIQVPDSVNKSLKRGHVPRTQIHYPRYSFQNQVAVNAVWIGSANSGVHESRNMLVGGHDHCNCGVEQVRPAIGPGWIPWNPAMVPTHEQHRMCRELYSNLVCPQSAVTRESIVNQNRQNFFTIKEEVSADKEDECSEEDDIESIGSPRSLASSGSTSSRDDTLINLSSELLSSSGAQAPAAKPRSQQVNPWGKASYSDLITMAITSTDDNMMTLSDIYSWIVKNVPYFNDKGTYLSVQGWKNAVRHTLSLRKRFVRVPDPKRPYKSMWTISDDYQRNHLKDKQRHLKTKRRSENAQGSSQTMDLDEAAS